MLETVAKIHTDFPSKFGIPRQSGLVEGLVGKIVLEPPFRSPQAVRGLEEFSHIWLIWGFSSNEPGHWSLTVRPPRLGGKKRMGVFATRSPFRPNQLGLSCVTLERVEPQTPEGPVLWVRGADLLDGTPIYDIKPYLPYTDSHPEASQGFTAQTRAHRLQVEFPPQLLDCYPPDKQGAAIEVLAQDPRPAYVMDPQRVYGVSFGGYDIRFQVEGEKLTVRDVVPLDGK